MSIFVEWLGKRGERWWLWGLARLTNSQVSVQAPSTPSRSKQSLAREKEGPGPSRRFVAGSDILDNNGVNALMALLMSVGGMVVAGLVFGFGADKSSKYFPSFSLG